MRQASNGDTVKVHYTGRLEDGTEFDSSISRQPLEFRIGENRVIRGFEQAVIGMALGESKTAKIAAADGFGPHHDELVLQVERSQFSDDVEPQVNQQVQVSRADGQTFAAMITDVSSSTVTLDANHPLAGKDLTLDIQLVDIV